jgi:hypothetical protein
MIFVAVVALALALLILVRRLAANKVEGFMQNVRVQAGLPPNATLSDFDVPVTREMMRSIMFDAFLSRFWIVLFALIVMAAWVTIAYIPSGTVRASVPGVEPEIR